MVELATKTGINQSLISKYESGKRIPSEKHIALLSQAIDIPLTLLRKELMADKIAHLIQYEVDIKEILKAAEDRIAYLTSDRVLEAPQLTDDILRKLEEIDALQTSWNNKKPLNTTQLQKLEAYFDVKYSFESNRIEGNTLTLQETHLVINEGITIAGKSLKEHLEAINHNEAVHWLKALATGSEDLNKRNLLDLHQLILKSIDSSHAGVYRTVPVMIGGSEFKPPQPLLIEDLMTDYFVHYQRQKRILHPVILAAEMHERLVSIHPFIDGNGRTSRLVMNFILLKNGYTVANIKGDPTSRLAYYSALQEVQVNNNPEPFYHLIIDKVKESLTEHIALI